MGTTSSFAFIAVSLPRSARCFQRRTTDGETSSSRVSSASEILTPKNPADLLSLELRVEDPASVRTPLCVSIESISFENHTTLPKCLGELGCTAPPNVAIME